MNEEIFIRKANKLLGRIRRDYDMLEDILGDVKALYLLCYNYLDLKKEDKDVTDTQMRPRSDMGP